MLTTQVKIVIASCIVLCATYAGWWLRDLQEDAADGARAIAEAAAEDRMNALANRVSKNTETAISSIRIENRNIYNETQREIKTNTVYHDCVLPDDGLRIANKARTGSASKSSDTLSANPSATGEGNNGRASGG